MPVDRALAGPRAAAAGVLVAEDPGRDSPRAPPLHRHDRGEQADHRCAHGGSEVGGARVDGDDTLRAGEDLGELSEAGPPARVSD